MKKKILSIILCCLVIIGMIPVQVFAEYSDDKVPYGYTGIYTAEDLDNIRNDLSGRYALMADIDLTEATAEGGSLDCGYGWLPIGDTYYDNFSGIFLGRNHTITGLRIEGRTADNSGLFGYVTGTITDLILKNANILAKNNVGGIAGLVFDNGMISNSSVYGVIQGSTENVGGIVGYSGNFAKVNQNYNYSNVIASKNSGGIVGFQDDGGEVSQCVNYGNISADNSSGGITGYMDGYIIEQCFNAGNVTANENAGGIIGSYYRTKLCDCYNIGSIKAIKLYVGGIVGSCKDDYVTDIENCINIGNVDGEHAGGVVGYGDSEISSSYYLRGTACTGFGYGENINTISLSSEQMKYKNSFYDFDFDNIWIIDLGSDIKRPQLRNARETEDSGVVIEPEKHDDVLPDGYKGIYTVQDLYAVRNDLESNYILMRDIDLTEATASGGDYDCNGQGWLPISVFSRIFDGNGHTISGLRIENRSADYSGLFGTVYGGTIKNLNLKNVNINAQAYTGGIAGIIKKNVLPIQNTLTNCTFDGNIKGTDNVGGLVGFVDASNVTINYYNKNYSAILNCSSKGKIEGNNNVGGLFGYLSFSAFSECYNISNVYGINNVGGVVGNIANYPYHYVDNTSHVDTYYYFSSKNKDSYNSGNIYGESNIGGICGNAIAQVDMAYSNCFNAGNITGLNSTGAIGGNIQGTKNSFNNCYYLTGSADNVAGVGECIAKSLTKTEMAQQSSFASFDFNDVWILETSAGMKYPQLMNNLENPVEEINVKKVGNKVTFYHHEKLDVNGLTINVKYKDLDGLAVHTVSNDMVSGYDPEKLGEQVLTITYLGAKTDYTVNVIELSVSEVSLNKQNLVVDVDKTEKLTAYVKPANATNQSIKWTSDNTDIAVVDENGNVKGISRGTASITATAASGAAVTCKVTVLLPANKVTLDKNELNLNRGDKATLTVTLDPSDTTDTIAWETDNANVVMVLNGNLTAVGAGSATVTVTTSRGKTAQCTVNVYVPSTKLTIISSVDTIELIDTIKLKTEITPSDSTDKIQWKSSDTKIAIVSADGTVTPVAEGTVTITATSTSGEKAEKTIKIIKHTHTFGKPTVITAATCLKPGVSEKVCTKCKFVQRDNIDATGHKEEIIKGYDSTCTKKGLTDGKKCSTCGIILEPQKDIAIKPHTKKVVKGYSQTYSKPGLTDGEVCSVCGRILKAQKEIPSLDSQKDPSRCVFTELPDGTLKLIYYYGNDTEFNIPSESFGVKVSQIGAGAFDDFGYTLKKIKFPKDVYIEFGAFLCYSSLEEVILSDGDSIDEFVFGECESLSKVTIAGGVDTISAAAFAFCYKLSDVTIEDGVKTIGQNAFLETGLKEITVPKSVTKIEDGALGYNTDNNSQMLVKNEDFVIYGYSGTEAERYANENGFEFIDLENPVCKHKKTELRNIKGATCTEPGYTGDIVCLRCNEIVERGTEVPALGHVEIIENGKEATCVDSGFTDFAQCFVCGVIIRNHKVIPALGHTFDKGVCTVCGAIDPDYKVVLNSLNEQIKVDNESKSVSMAPAKTFGMKVSEFKKQFDGEISIDIDDNSLVANGTKFKFGDNEFTVIVKGDVRADGKITASDARMVLRIAARLESVDADAFSAADINGDGKVTAGEARKVLRFSAKLESSML